MAETVLLPVATLTVQANAPTINDHNAVLMPRATLLVAAPEPTIVAGQLKLRYSGVRMGIKTRLGTAIDG